MRLSATVAFALLAPPGRRLREGDLLGRAAGPGHLGLPAFRLQEPRGAAQAVREDTEQALEQARNFNRPETDRMLGYIELYRSLRQRTQAYEQAMACNPDLSYREEARPLVAAQETCVRQLADVQVEFEAYVRELVAVPTAQDIKGGNTVTVARLDFATLRQAIRVLAPDDAEALLARVEGAEQRLGTRGRGRAQSLTPALSQREGYRLYSVR